MRRMELSGSSLQEIRAWLADQGVVAGKSSVHRCMERIRAKVPHEQPPAVAPKLEAYNDDDELRDIKRVMRASLLTPGLQGDDWKEQHSAAKFLWAANQAKAQTKPGQQPTAPVEQKPPDSVVFN